MRKEVENKSSVRPQIIAALAGNCYHRRIFSTKALCSDRIILS